MPMRFLLSLGCCLVVCSSIAQSFLPVADSIRKARGIPAIAYAIFSDNAIIEMGVSGYRKYRTRDSIRINDRFHLGTNTFAFVSWIAGRLVESGKIKWTTTFVSLFPEYKDKILAQYSTIDLKSLLSNTAGLAPYKQFDDYVSVPAFSPDPQLQRKEFASWVLQRPGLSEKRNNKMAESIAGYTIAVVMLEKASGLSWEKMIDSYVNKPLVIDAKFGWPHSISPAEPWGHWSKYGGLSAEPGNTWVKQHPAILSSSGVNISVPEYAKFLQDGLRGLRGGKANLSQRTLELIHFGIPDYAFGWENGVIGTLRIASHTGESFLFNSHVDLIPEKNIGILVVCNDGDSMGKGAVLNFARLLRDSLLSQ